MIYFAVYLFHQFPPGSSILFTHFFLWGQGKAWGWEFLLPFMISVNFKLFPWASAFWSTQMGIKKFDLIKWEIRLDITLFLHCSFFVPKKESMNGILGWKQIHILDARKVYSWMVLFCLYHHWDRHRFWQGLCLSISKHRLPLLEKMWVHMAVGRSVLLW